MEGGQAKGEKEDRKERRKEGGKARWSIIQASRLMHPMPQRYLFCHSNGKGQEKLHRGVIQSLPWRDNEGEGRGRGGFCGIFRFAMI